MDVRIGLLVLFLLGVNWCCDARQLANPYFSEMQIKYVTQDNEIKHLKDVTKEGNICTLCEEYAAQALDYLGKNKTQTEILEILHHSCSQLQSFKQKISTVQPIEFCRKVNLCQQVVMISSQLREDSCGLCHRAVSEVLTKLKNPETQLEIIEVLLKACNTMKDFERKCKRMVFEYGPLILANAEQYLETTDICTALHACNSPAVISRDAEETLHSDS